MKSTSVLQKGWSNALFSDPGVLYVSYVACINLPASSIRRGSSAVTNRKGMY